MLFILANEGYLIEIYDSVVNAEGSYIIAEMQSKCTDGTDKFKNGLIMENSKITGFTLAM